MLILFIKNNNLCVINSYSIILNFNLTEKNILNLLFEEQMFYIEKKQISALKVEQILNFEMF